MKVVNAFVNVFSVLVFLTIGSFLIIVSLHLVSQDDALRAVTELYAEPLRSLQAGLMGFLFVFVGLSFAKFLIKSHRGDDALVLEGEGGVITVSIFAIEDLIKKVVHKFEGVKSFRTKTVVREKTLSSKIKLNLWSGYLIPDVTRQLEREIRVRLEKVLGVSERVEIAISVQKVVTAQKPKSKTV